MTTLQVNAVSTGPCDECPRFRTFVTEQEQKHQVRVTILAGCATCEGSTVVLANA